MKTIQRLLLSYIFILGLFACEPNTSESPMGEFEQGVLVMNEGAFGANDGEVFHYNPITGEIKRNIFEAKNGRPFAGLLQHMVEAGGKLYLVANTGKIEIVNPKDFTSLGAVSTDLNVTRSVALANQKLYISDWGPYDISFNSPSSYIAVVNNPNGGPISKKIPVSSRPEGLAIVGNNLLVACASDKKLDVINLSTESVSNSITVTGTPVRFIDVTGRLYLYAYDAEKVYLHEINRNTFAVLTTLSFNIANATSTFTVGFDGNLYVITSTGWPTYNDAVVKVTLGSTASISTLYTGSGFYGVGTHPETNEIYVTDNNGFQGNGTIIVLDPNGRELKTFEAGRGPSGFLFK